MSMLGSIGQTTVIRPQPMTRQIVNYIVRLAGEKAKLGRVWPHMLRHRCGYLRRHWGTVLHLVSGHACFAHLPGAAPAS